MKKRTGIKATLLAGVAALGIMSMPQEAKADQSFGDVLLDGLEQSVLGSVNNTAARAEANAVCRSHGKLPLFRNTGNRNAGIYNGNRRSNSNSNVAYSCVWPHEHPVYIEQQRQARMQGVDSHYHSAYSLDLNRASSGVDDPLLRAEIRARVERERAAAEAAARTSTVNNTNTQVVVVQTTPEVEKRSVTEEQFLALQEICISRTLEEDTVLGNNRSYNTVVSECNTKTGRNNVIRR